MRRLTHTETHERRTSEKHHSHTEYVYDDARDVRRRRTRKVISGLGTVFIVVPVEFLSACWFYGLKPILTVTWRHVVVRSAAHVAHAYFDVCRASLESERRLGGGENTLPVKMFYWREPGDDVKQLTADAGEQED